MLDVFNGGVFMVFAYPACFFKEENGYSVIFPDLNYLGTSGSSVEEAFEMAVDCLAGYLYWLQQDDEDIPEPSKMSDVKIEDLMRELEIDSEEFFVNMVTVDVKEYAKAHFEKAVKKTLTIPAWLNKMASEQGVNFSQVLQEALKERLKCNKAKV